MNRRAVLAVLLLAAAAHAARQAGASTEVITEVVGLAAVVGLLVGVVLAVTDRTWVPPPAPRSSDDGEPDEARRMAARVRAAERSRHGLHTQLLPDLRLLVADHLAHLGVDPADGLAVRAALGPDLDDLLRLERDAVTDRDAPGLPVSDLLAHLRRLETT